MNVPKLVSAARPPLPPRKSPKLVSAARPPLLPRKSPKLVSAARPPLPPRKSPTIVSAARPPLPPRKKKDTSSSTPGASHRLMRQEAQTVEGMKPCSPTKASRQSRVEGRWEALVGEHHRPSTKSLTPAPSRLSPYAAVMPPPSNEMLRRASAPDLAAAFSLIKLQSGMTSHRAGVVDVPSVGEEVGSHTDAKRHNIPGVVDDGEDIARLTAAKPHNIADVVDVAKSGAPHAVAKRLNIPDVVDDGEDVARRTAAKLHNIADVVDVARGGAPHTVAKRRNFPDVVDDVEDVARHTAVKHHSIADVAKAAKGGAPHTDSNRPSVADLTDDGEEAAPQIAAKRRAAKRHSTTDAANAGEDVPPHPTAKRCRETGMAATCGIAVPNAATSVPGVGAKKLAPTLADTPARTSAASQAILAATVAVAWAFATDNTSSHQIGIAEVADGITVPQLDVISHQVRDTYPVAPIAAASRCGQKRGLDASPSERLAKRACVKVTDFMTRAEVNSRKGGSSKEVQSKRKRKRCHSASEEPSRKRSKATAFPTEGQGHPVAVC